MSLVGKVAIVTGSGRGLGLSYAQELARQGASVIINDVDMATVEAAVSAITESGGKAAGVVAAVGSTEAAKALVAGAIENFGRLDILVTNAGVLRDKSLLKMTDEDFDLVINVHLRGTFTCVREAYGYFKENQVAGRIIAIGSPTGQRGNFGQTNYAAAKAGLHGFTMSLAREVAAKGITVNSLSPGYVATPMTAQMPPEVLARTVASVPVGRVGQPADIARAVVFLVADDAGYITGINLQVNGGLLMGF